MMLRCLSDEATFGADRLGSASDAIMVTGERLAKQCSQTVPLTLAPLAVLVVPLGAVGALTGCGLQAAHAIAGTAYLVALPVAVAAAPAAVAATEADVRTRQGAATAACVAALPASLAIGAVSLLPGVTAAGAANWLLHASVPGAFVPRVNTALNPATALPFWLVVRTLSSLGLGGRMLGALCCCLPALPLALLQRQGWLERERLEAVGQKLQARLPPRWRRPQLPTAPTAGTKRWSWNAAYIFANTQGRTARAKELEGAEE